MEQFLQQVINGLSIGSIYALIALGYTMVYGVLRLINFAHGEIYMIGAFVGFYTASFILLHDLPLPVLIVTILSAMIVCGFLAAVIEFVAYRPLRKQPRLTALITAIGMSLLLQNGGQIIFGADPKRFPDLMPSYNLLGDYGLTLTLIDFLIFSITIILLAVLFWIVKFSRLGRAMRAVSESPQVASLMGVNVDRVITMTFVIGAVLAGVAGVLVGVSKPAINPLMGLMPGIKAFAAAVLGGIGNIPGAVVGGLIIGLAETFVAASDWGAYRDAIAFIILIVILLFKPTGIFGKSVSEKV